MFGHITIQIWAQLMPTLSFWICKQLIISHTLILDMNALMFAHPPIQDMDPIYLYIGCINRAHPLILDMETTNVCPLHSSNRPN